MINKPLSILASPDYVDEAPRFLDQIRRGERIDHYETVRLRKDGTRIDISLTMSPVVVAGKIVGASIIGRDITKRKRVEEILTASEIRYRRLFESAKDGILILDFDTGTVDDVNPFLVELLGFPYEQFRGKAIWELGFLKDIVANQSNFSELQEKGYVHYEDLPLETADGRPIDVEFVSNVYEVDHQRVIQCNIRDITERKQAEDERERLILALGEALTQVKTLRGFLPICASCKKIRNDKGYWEQMEVYIRDHSEAEFSHGICPDCAEKLYPEYYKKK
jgi:PAS domain S-box-containing protein